jgi:hypothetical protein
MIMEFKTLEFDLSNERVIFKPFEKEGHLKSTAEF